MSSAASFLLLRARPLRQGAVVTNTGTNAVWIALGPTAVRGIGIYLTAYGGAITLESAEYTGPVSAISESGTNIVAVAETYEE